MTFTPILTWLTPTYKRYLTIISDENIGSIVFTTITYFFSDAIYNVDRTKSTIHALFCSTKFNFTPSAAIFLGTVTAKFLTQPMLNAFSTVLFNECQLSFRIRKIIS